MRTVVLRLTFPDDVKVEIEQMGEQEVRSASGPERVTSQRWSAGDIHERGHKPLKMGKRGLFCPTKVDGDRWCPWPDR